MLSYKPLVMVIDDEAGIGECICDLVEMQLPHYRSMAVDNGRGGIEAALREKPALILLDLFLNDGLDGVMALRAIRDGHSDAKVLVMSGYAEAALRETQRAMADELDRLGIMGYITKPVEPMELIQKIKHALD